jgi:hypothetical protein
MENKTNKTWKPTTAGILSIIAGVPAAGSGIIVALVGSTMAWADIVPLVPNILGIIAIPLMVLGVIAIVGGIFALQRKIWGLALAGAICALASPLSILGVLSIIFVVIGKDEFD